MTESKIKEVTPIKYKAKNHESYILFTLIAVIVPVVAVLLGVLYLAKDDPLDKKLGEHAIALGVLFCIIWPIVWFVFVTLSQPTPTIPAY